MRPLDEKTRLELAQDIIERTHRQRAQELRARMVRIGDWIYRDTYDERFRAQMAGIHPIFTAKSAWIRADIGAYGVVEFPMSEERLFPAVMVGKAVARFSDEDLIAQDAIMAAEERRLFGQVVEAAITSLEGWLSSHDTVEAFIEAWPEMGPAIEQFFERECASEEA